MSRARGMLRLVFESMNSKAAALTNILFIAMCSFYALFTPILSFYLVFKAKPKARAHLLKSRVQSAR